MATLMNTLGIDRLSADARFQLMHEIWDSLVPEAEQQPLSEAQIQELDRRVSKLDANPEAVTPWETVEARAMKRLGR